MKNRNSCLNSSLDFKGRFGTIEEFRNQADKLVSNWEEIFLRLTKQDSSVEEIVKNLRATYKKKIKEVG